jgi:pantothenate kinase
VSESSGVVRATTGELVERAARLASVASADGRRRILGITGPPGAGKSTLAAAISRALGPRVAVVGQDGFHLAQRELVALGRTERKGAPDTFDDAGYAALLARIRARGGETDGADRVVYAPEFRRDLEEPVGSAIPVRAGVPLVVTEGNYLLWEGGAWPRARACLDEVWYLAPPASARRAALVRRHESYGRSRAEAREWVGRSDEANAALVAATSHRADLVVDVWFDDGSQAAGGSG